MGVGEGLRALCFGFSAGELICINWAQNLGCFALVGLGLHAFQGFRFWGLRLQCVFWFCVSGFMVERLAASGAIV